MHFCKCECKHKCDCGNTKTLDELYDDEEEDNALVSKENEEGKDSLFRNFGNYFNKKVESGAESGKCFIRAMGNLLGNIVEKTKNITNKLTGK